MDFFICRLGADSEAAIKKIDDISNYGISPFTIAVLCKQVPNELNPGDFVIIWLGTNNSKGTKTPWIQGIRALGRVKFVKGDEGYNQQKEISITVGIVLPKSVTKLDLVEQSAVPYANLATMPVVGVNNYSSQVIQKIDHGRAPRAISHLLLAIESIVPGFNEAVLQEYPQLSTVISQARYQNKEHLDSPISNIGSNDATDEDENGLERERDAGSEIIDIPFDPTKIDIVAKPMTISSLEGRLENCELDLTPDFQRQANVWDVKRKARLIESILLRIPLPSFYFSEDKDGGYAVVDGLQRLCAVFHFSNVGLLNEVTGAKLSPLRLKGLQYLKELEGRTFDELDRKFQRRVSELEITANIIRANTPSAVKFNVFARLNQGGLPLNAQEIRNAIFPGEWRNYIRELAESEEFRSATDGKVQQARQQDMELVLRYVSLWQIGRPYRRGSNQTLDEFLNSTVENILLHWDEKRWREAQQTFYKAIDRTCQILGKHAFRKSAGVDARMPINRGLFECQMIVFGDMSDDEFSRVIKRKSKLEKLFKEALRNNKDFIQALLYGTGTAEASSDRIAVYRKIIKEVIND